MEAKLKSCIGCRQIPGLKPFTPPERTIHGKRISAKEALAGLGPRKDWPKFKKKMMRKFRKKPSTG